MSSPYPLLKLFVALTALEFLVQISMKPFAVAQWHLECAVVAGNHQDFSRAVEKSRTPAAVTQVIFDLPTQFRIDCIGQKIRQFGDYFLARDHGFIPFSNVN